MPLDVTPFVLAGQPVETADVRDATDPWGGGVVGRVCHADASHLGSALEASARVAKRTAATPGHVRRDVLLGCLRRIEAEHEELARLCRAEAGKPVTAARGEVSRMFDTFRAAAEEATRIVGSGEVLALDVASSAAGYRGMVKRLPVGPCAFITPFNFPLNLVAHKIAPAIAAGCPFVLKPAPATPGCALRLAHILVDTMREHGYPAESVSVLPMDVEVAETLVTDDRPKLLSFTGSAAVGWVLKAKAGRKKVTLELGGNAACVVDEGVDVEAAVKKIVPGAFGYAGQSCISVQRLLVHDSCYETLRERLVAVVSSLKCADPADESTTVGPVINDVAGRRIRSWIAEAVAAGASVCCGEDGAGGSGNRLDATVLEGVPHNAGLWREEVFGPVVILERFAEFDNALATVNDSDFGLQAGVFTPSLDHAMRAWDTLEVGGVVINQVPSWRVDPMPYGGVKGSGLGREGVRYAVEDMTEPRLLVVAP